MCTFYKILCLKLKCVFYLHIKMCVFKNFFYICVFVCVAWIEMVVLIVDSGLVLSSPSRVGGADLASASSAGRRWSDRSQHIWALALGFSVCRQLVRCWRLLVVARGGGARQNQVGIHYMGIGFVKKQQRNTIFLH